MEWDHNYPSEDSAWSIATEEKTEEKTNCQHEK